MKIKKNIILAIMFVFMTSIILKAYSAKAADSNNNLILSIDSTKYYSNDRLQIAGWMLASKEIKNVDVYINQISKGSFGTSINREDVFNAYKEYGNHNSGFNFVCNISDIKDGDNSIKFVAITKDGQVIESTKNINIKKPQGFLVAVDPGHSCGGHDIGTNAVINGSTYQESVLNLQISNKLKEKLQNAGYSVIMTRVDNNPLADSETDSLEKRCEIANNKKANLFISIHQNVFDKTVNGTEGYYYENNEKAKELVSEITKNISAILGNDNRGAKVDTVVSKDKGLYVIRHTNMTSILVECGFMDSSDGPKLLDENNQNKIAEAITNAVIKVYGTSNCYEKGEPYAITKSNISSDVTTNTPIATGSLNTTKTPSATSTQGNVATATTATSQVPNKPSDGNKGNTFDQHNILVFMAIMMLSTIFCLKYKKMN